MDSKNSNNDTKVSFNEEGKSLCQSPSMKERIPPSKTKLGGSKFTILSEGELEELLHEREQILEESAIILDVFKASDSQIRKWEHAKLNSQWGKPTWYSDIFFSYRINWATYDQVIFNDGHFDFPLLFELK